MEADLAAKAIPERAKEWVARFALGLFQSEVTLWKELEEPTSKAEALKAELASPDTPRTDVVMRRRQLEKAEREVAKLQGKLSRLRADACKELRDGANPLGDWPTSLEEAKRAEAEQTQVAATAGRAAAILAHRINLATRAKEEANAKLDAAVSAAYKSAALKAHPDKRRGDSSADGTLAFQRLRTAYETLRDGSLRRSYIDTMDHDAFLANQATAVASAAAESAREAAGRRPTKGAPKGALRLEQGVPNRCTCPLVAVVGDDTLLLQWSCNRIASHDLVGYELDGALRRGAAGREPWATLRAASAQQRTSTTLSGMAPGEWAFRVRAVSAVGPGDWSIASEGVLLGKDDDPEDAARRALEAKQRAASRRAELQDSCRDTLARWSVASARGVPDALDKLSADVALARRSGLPSTASDGALLQRAENLLRELRAASATRAAMAEWRPLLRDLSRRAVLEDMAAIQFRHLIQNFTEVEDNAGVHDTAHQLIKRCGVDARASLEACERVLPVLHTAAGRTDLWARGKIAELEEMAEGLQGMLESARIAAARRVAAAAKKAEKAQREAQARNAILDAQAMEADLLRRQQLAAMELMQRQKADAEAAVRAAQVQAAATAARPSHAAPPHVAGDSEDCPICLEVWSTQTLPLAFPCGHLVCAHCTDKLRQSNSCRCPTCRQPFSPQAQLPVNVAVRDHAMNLRSRQAPPPMPLPMAVPSKPLPRPTAPLPKALPVPLPIPPPRRAAAVAGLPHPAPLPACSPLPASSNDQTMQSLFPWLFPK